MFQVEVQLSRSARLSVRADVSDGLDMEMSLFQLQRGSAEGSSVTVGLPDLEECYSGTKWAFENPGNPP